MKNDEDEDRKCHKDLVETELSMESLVEAAGTSGWRNYLIYIFALWASFVSPMHSVSYQFLGATPGYWCNIEELQLANWTDEQIRSFSMPLEGNSSVLASCKAYDFNYTLAAQFGYEKSLEVFNASEAGLRSCNVRTFDPLAPITVVSKWDLVCERRPLYSTTQATVQAGKFFGSLTMAYLVDIYGRKKPIVWNIIVYFIIGILTVFSPNITCYLILKFFTAAVAVAFYMGGLLLALELCSKDQRSYVGPLSAIPWAIGYIICPGIAYLIRPFPYLETAFTVPVLTALPSFWILVESPRWLVLKGRYEEAIAVLEKLAKYNNRELPSKEKMLHVMDSIYKEQLSQESEKRRFKVDFYKFFELFLLKEWRLKIPAIFFGWFASSMVYYGVSLNPPNLGEGKYMYIFIGGLLEIPSYIILIPLCKYVGRTKTFVLLFASSAISILGSMGVSLSSEERRSEDLPQHIQHWMMFLSLFGKFAISSAFQLVWMYTPELIPTEHRSIVTGQASMFSRFGSISSPYIVDLMGESHRWSPSAIFGGVSIVAGIMLCFLPETADVALKDSSQAKNENESIEMPEEKQS